MTDQKQHATMFVIIHESILQSWVRDFSTLALFVGLVSIGIVLGSAALQWIGAAVGFITILARAGGNTKRMTKTDAIKYLQDFSA